ncbi:hypothetical protein CY35_02G165700 [Sphagnum magellanicum]|nr:hypothetical protein CY35_02G165700 [Sphagnum magellanicum]
MSFMKGDLLSKARKLMKGGIMARPRWLDAVIRVPPQPKKTRCHRAPNIKLPEDRLVESYYARHPEAKFIPFEINSFDPPPARKFAWRQLELMEQGYFRDQACDIVEAEFEAAEKAELEALKAERRRAIWEGREPPPLKLTKTEEVQQEEWENIVHGLNVLGSQGRKAGDKLLGSDPPRKVSAFS